MSLLRLDRVVKVHHRSLAENEQAGSRRQIIRLYGPAVVSLLMLTVLEVVGWDELNLDGNLTDALVAALALFAGVLFSIGVVVLDKTVDLDLAGPDPTEGTNRAVLRLLYISANALYSAVVAGALVGVLLLGSLVDSLEKPAAIVGVGGLVLLASTGALVIGRLFADTQSRVDRVRSGASRADRASSDRHA